MANLSRSNAPDLATTFTCTVLQFTILVLGIINFYGVLSFCQASNKSKEHPWVKIALLMLMYLYAPIAIICISLSWISWDRDWSAGWFFIWFAFVVPVLFFFVVFATKNDISHFIDVHRLSRAKLPQQAPPRKFVVPRTPNRRDDFDDIVAAPPPPFSPGPNNAMRSPPNYQMPPPHGGFQSPPRHSVINMDHPPVIPQTESRAAQPYLDDDDAIGGNW